MSKSPKSSPSPSLSPSGGGFHVVVHIDESFAPKTVEMDLPNTPEIRDWLKHTHVGYKRTITKL